MTGCVFPPLFPKTLWDRNRHLCAAINLCSHQPARFNGYCHVLPNNNSPLKGPYALNCFGYWSLLTISYYYAAQICCMTLLYLTTPPPIVCFFWPPLCPSLCSLYHICSISPQQKDLVCICACYFLICRSGMYQNHRKDNSCNKRLLSDLKVRFVFYCFTCCQYLGQPIYIL